MTSHQKHSGVMIRRQCNCNLPGGGRIVGEGVGSLWDGPVAMWHIKSYVNVNMGSIGWSVVRAPFIILEAFFYKLYVLLTNLSLL